ncbi:hypothetical protein D9757_002027 [Collybiopsis confluens]|uniref:Uncharacterized protein n=1 Tax=Collybiopsis confluens TaxID=2823264 RepID=A0A8H5MF25_9AGAR|nr:hypothetical protein D9757_002027 [Collybiopsis confluens]
MLRLRALSTTPWFVHSEPVSSAIPRSTRPPTPVPIDAPKILHDLHSHLAQSPHLDLSRLLVGRAVPTEMGPPLPRRAPHGKRNRGGTFAGESAFDIPGSLWNWTVKEGTENKGAIESVVRTVRKSLLTAEPPLPLGPNSKRRMQNGWAMIDAGDIAIHVLSKSVREKYFGAESTPLIRF